MATLYIKDLLISAKHGVHQHEKENAQNFRVSVELTFDTTKASMSDELTDTLNWSAARKDIIKTVQDNSFNLMERLAQVIADTMLLHEGVSKVVVSLDKPDAFETGYPGIRLEVDRKEN